MLGFIVTEGSLIRILKDDDIILGGKLISIVICLRFVLFPSSFQKMYWKCIITETGIFKQDSNALFFVEICYLVDFHYNFSGVNR